MNRERNIAASYECRAEPTLPVLTEGTEYLLELGASETLVSAVLRAIVDDAPLGRGFSFQLATGRMFVYERDLYPGPSGLLIVAGQ